MKILLASVLSLLCWSYSQAQVYGEIGRGGYDRNSCSAEMRAHNGIVIDIFEGRDCRDALDRCDYDLRQRQARGMNPYASCVISQDYGRGDTPGRGNREWVQVDEVHFYDGKTAVAIQNCKQARATDFRCVNSRQHQCGACSEISHSDHSSYVVYQLINGHRPGRPNPGPAPVERVFERTFHYYHRKTAEARAQCERERSAMPQCRSRNYECTPCTRESHTDHSQFDLYRLVRRH